MQGIKGTKDEMITGLVEYTRKLPQHGKVAVWVVDRYNRGGDYQPRQVVVSVAVARKAI